MAEEITDGSYETRITVKSQDEVGLLALSYIFFEGRRLERMSGKLFDLIYLREHEMEKEAVQAENVSSEVLKVVTPSFAAKGLVLKENIEPAVLYGNKELLVTALVNLLDNARKASKEHGVIEFSGKRIQEEENPFYYELFVKDYGIGMTKEETERICDEFYMADKSRSRKEGGAGLGMTLCSRIVKLHHAHWKIFSKSGEGTVVAICFPYGEDTI